MNEATEDGKFVAVHFAGDRTGKKVVLEMKWLALVEGVDIYSGISFFKFLKVQQVRIMRFDLVDVHVVFLAAFDQKAPKVLLLNLETDRTSVLSLAEFSRKVPLMLKARKKRFVEAGPLLNACIAHIKAACIAWKKTEDDVQLPKNAVQFSVAKAAAPVTAPSTDENIAKKAAAGSVKVLGFYLCLWYGIVTSNIMLNSLTASL